MKASPEHKTYLLERNLKCLGYRKSHEPFQGTPENIVANEGWQGKRILGIFMHVGKIEKLNTSSSNRVGNVTQSTITSTRGLKKLEQYGHDLDWTAQKISINFELSAYRTWSKSRYLQQSTWTDDWADIKSMYAIHGVSSMWGTDTRCVRKARRNHELCGSWSRGDCSPSAILICLTVDCLFSACLSLVAFGTFLIVCRKKPPFLFALSEPARSKRKQQRSCAAS